MYALSLTDPYASLIAVGAKCIETRSFRTIHRGWLAIHAAKTMPADAVAFAASDLVTGPLIRAGVLPRDWKHWTYSRASLHRVGKIARRSDGAVTVGGRDLPVTDEELAFGDYTPGRYGWVLTNVRRLATPIPARGTLGLWRVPDGIVRQIEKQQGIDVGLVAPGAEAAATR